MNIKVIIENLYDKIKIIEDNGQLANYIPELTRVNSESFGIHISTVEGLNYGVGNCFDQFSIQSIVKVLSLIISYRILGEDLWKRVKVEPSGTAFNSLVQLEVENGIPRNPFINAGALVIADILLTHLDNPEKDFLDFVKNLSHSREIS
ncbi:MAG TPA: glutaminase, partial [Gammaproteobacteria bacterium]|nr:glutaminase [Gammaproteobacteria bacterium]